MPDRLDYRHTQAVYQLLQSRFVIVAVSHIEFDLDEFMIMQSPVKFVQYAGR